MHIFPTPKTVFTPCDKAKDFLTKNGLSFTSAPAVAGEEVVTKINDVELKGFKEEEIDLEDVFLGITKGITN